MTDVADIVSKVKDKVNSAIVDKIDEPTKKPRKTTRKRTKTTDIKEETVGDVSEEHISDMDRQMQESMMAQSGLGFDLIPGMKYPHCLLHGFVSPTDPIAARQFCCICGSKMTMRVYNG